MIRVEFCPESISFDCDTDEEYSYVMKVARKFRRRKGEIRAADKHLMYIDEPFALMYALSEFSMDSRFGMVMFV